MSISIYSLPNLYEQKKNRNLLQSLLTLISDKTGVKKSDIIGPHRDNEFLEPRFIYFYLARKRTVHKLHEIGKACGNRSHGAVMNGISTLTDRLDVEKDLVKKVDEIEKAFIRMIAASIFTMLEM